jgi:signal peptidase I
MTRDPRTDPRPGDVVKFSDGVKRRVTERNRSFVHYEVDGNGGEVFAGSYMPVRLWRSWSATIIQRGDDE